MPSGRASVRGAEQTSKRGRASRQRVRNDHEQGSWNTGRDPEFQALSARSTSRTTMRGRATQTDRHGGRPWGQYHERGARTTPLSPWWTRRSTGKNHAPKDGVDGVVEHSVNGEIEAKTTVGTMVERDVSARKRRVKTGYVQRSSTKRRTNGSTIHRGIDTISRP